MTKISCRQRSYKYIRSMKQLLIFLTTAIIMAGCAVKVRNVYDPKIEFKRYKNFCWLESCEFTFKGPDYLNDSLVKARMQRVIKKEMKKRGINFNSDTPDFLMDVQVVVETDTAFLYHRSDEVYSFIPFTKAEQVFMLKGTLIIDIIDKKTGKMAWRSVAVSYFDLYPDLSEESLGKGVAAALKNFPPAAK